MKTISHVVLCMLIALPLSVSASAKVTEQNEIVTEEIPRPAHIWVYDFSATASDIPPDSALAGQVAEHNPPQTEEQIATGRKLGAEIASQLVEQIRAMGMSAARPTSETKPEINDIVIHGYLVSVVAGSKEKRMAIGFGSGESELKVAAEGFQVTAQGLRALGSGSTDSTGGKAPGASLGVVGLIAMHNPIGLIVSTGMKEHGEKTGSSTLEGRAKDTAKEIAEVLKKRFQEQGWID